MRGRWRDEWKHLSRLTQTASKLDYLAFQLIPIVRVNEAFHAPVITFPHIGLAETFTENAYLRVGFRSRKPFRYFNQRAESICFMIANKNMEKELRVSGESFALLKYRPKSNQLFYVFPKWISSKGAWPEKIQLAAELIGTEMVCRLRFKSEWLRSLKAD